MKANRHTEGSTERSLMLAWRETVTGNPGAAQPVATDPGRASGLLLRACVWDCVRDCVWDCQGEVKIAEISILCAPMPSCECTGSTWPTPLLRDEVFVFVFVLPRYQC